MVDKVKEIIDEVVEKVFAEIPTTKGRDLDTDAVWADIYEQVTDELNYYKGIELDEVAPIAPPFPKTSVAGIKKEMKERMLEKIKDKAKVQK